ncbi:MAG: helix-turn-helix transcriptional regulator [Betaproteobacteria bacterium]
MRRFALRKKLSLSQEGLAAEAKRDRAYVSGIERGEHNVAVINLSKLAIALNMSLQDLMRLAKI